MPRNESFINFQGDKVAPKFDVRKFYANVLTTDAEDLGYADDLLGIDGA
jgi:hypothetical protein